MSRNALWSPFSFRATPSSDDDDDAHPRRPRAPASSPAVAPVKPPVVRHSHFPAHGVKIEESDKEVQTATAGIMSLALGPVASVAPVAAKVASSAFDDSPEVQSLAIATQMHLLHFMEPLVMRAISVSNDPGNRHAQLTTGIFAKWKELEAENKREPNMLHMTYMSVVMARCMTRVFDSLFSFQKNALLKHAIQVLGQKMEERMQVE